MDSDQNNLVPLLIRILEQRYDAVGVELHPLAQGEKNVYHVTHNDGPDWVLRVYRLPETETERLCPADELAARLLFLEQRHYPTERIVRAADGNAFIACDGLRLLMTSYLGASLHLWQPSIGDTNRNAAGFGYEPNIMRALGEMLGRLHSLEVAGVYPSLPVAGMLPGLELAWASECLEQCAGKIPTRFGAEYQYLLDEVRQIDRCDNLPCRFIHNDCNFGNVVITSRKQVAFVDWDGAGLGPAIVDVGFLLSNCFDKRERHLHTEALSAAVEGYSQHAWLTEAELARLSGTVRFRTLMVLACCFAERVDTSPHDNTLIYGAYYADWQAQYQASSEIVNLAQEQLQRFGR